MSGELGEVELKMTKLVEEVFNSCEIIEEDGEKSVSKESIRDFLIKAFEEAGQTDAWSDEEFDECYREFDYDGGGTISEDELIHFIKRFAAL